ncbi:ribbon-helix-helix domain-containing protein [Rhizobium sp. RU36D]|uniref:CopG family ribbon-helix-helix protein n=1 Tax=Rhizobium sp. RU36D TaxID=1907415 RepID=UPI0009D85FD8|nr:ribbon-helix-helix domain-containing protein [Rhizobium sp. RU36D]SMC96288.1 Ribbon-helix-helix protein, copG family [Rhizobium sp. RU36D]
MSNRELSDPITMRLPLDLLAEVEEVAGICERSRSWVIVRALKAYLAQEGREIRDIAKARGEVRDGGGHDLDSVLDEVEAIVKGAAA